MKTFPLDGAGLRLPLGPLSPSVKMSQPEKGNVEREGREFNKQQTTKYFFH